MLSLFSHLHSSYGSYRLCETYRVFSKKLKLQWPKLGHRNVYLYRSFHLEWVFLLTDVLRSPLNLHRQSFLESLFFLFPPVIAHEHMIGCSLLLGDFNKAFMHSYLVVSLSWPDCVVKQRWKRPGCALMNLLVSIP